MTLRIPSKMLNQNLQVSTLTADSINGVTDIAQFLSNTKATNGHQKLPGGVILQWGTTPSIAAGATSNILFSFTFPNQCTGFGYLPALTSGTYTFGYTALSNSGFTAYAGSGNGAATSMKWFAIGY